MKYILLLIYLGFSAIACTGDCMTCHPTLEKNILTDKRHSPMLTCIKCHKPDSDSMAECGKDCYSCHDVNKIEKTGIKEHMVIRECRDCHMKIKNTMINIEAKPSQSTNDTLKDFLLN